MELMANSDNVLRGGLTPKHVDVPELLKHVTFEATVPNILKGEAQSDGLERIYKSPAPDFELSQIKLSNNNVYSSTSSSAQILMVLEGDVELSEENENVISLSKGKSALILANCKYAITAKSSAIIFKATAP